MNLKEWRKETWRLKNCFEDMTYETCVIRDATLGSWTSAGLAWQKDKLNKQRARYQAKYRNSSKEIL